MDESIFIAEGERFTPTEHARGPWDPRALHGGAPAAFRGDDAFFGHRAIPFSLDRARRDHDDIAERPQQVEHPTVGVPTEATGFAVYRDRAIHAGHEVHPKPRHTGGGGRTSGFRRADQDVRVTIADRVSEYDEHTTTFTVPVP